LNRKIPLTKAAATQPFVM